MLSQQKQFDSENVLMSVLGHLVLVALLIGGAAVVINRAQLVAPDRIDIVEIDLKNVKITGDETKLYNVNIPDDKQSKQSETPKSQERIATPDSEHKIESTELADDTEHTKKPEKSDKKNPDDSSAPKKKTVVRVNREVLSLDRTLTVSVVDALRVAMTRCWVIDTTRPDISNIRAVAHMTMRTNGTVQDVWFESAAREKDDPAFAYVLETIRSAINTCQPFTMLPRNEFSKWQKIQLTFYPTQGKVM
ncbi:MAG: hypothetical protein KBS86_03740 [Proteobacteria bacterium]|nr:hypothetical protein [Candidatus Enterousia scatequi]